MTGRARIALAGLLLALAAVMAAWLAVDRRPTEWDRTNHLERSVSCRRSLAAAGEGRLEEIIVRSSSCPPILSLPAFLVDWIVRNFDPTPRLKRLPMPVSLATIRIVPGRLEVGDGAAATAQSKEPR